MDRGGQNRLVPSSICGTPIRSSGASWLPSSETHSKPTCAANCCTIEDFPIPGGPQMKTGRTGAIFSSSSARAAGVTVFVAFISAKSLIDWANNESRGSSRGHSNRGCNPTESSSTSGHLLRRATSSPSASLRAIRSARRQRPPNWSITTIRISAQSLLLKASMWAQCPINRYFYPSRGCASRLHWGCVCRTEEMDLDAWNHAVDAPCPVHKIGLQCLNQL